MDIQKQEAELIKHLARNDISEGRIEKYRLTYREIAALGINLENITEDEVDKYYFFLRQNREWKQWTKITKWRCFKKICRIFHKRIDDRIKFRDWKLKEPYSDIEILTLKEIVAMVEAAKTIRDKLLILVLYESACRAGEIANLQKHNLVFDDYGAILRVNGKTGPRDVRIVKSAPYLRYYVSLRSTEDIWGLSNFGILQMVKRTAKRAGITKKVNTKLFRHTRFTHIESELPDSILKKHMGWTRDSKMPRTYSHLSNRAVDPKIRKSINLAYVQPAFFLVS